MKPIRLAGLMAATALPATKRVPAPRQARGIAQDVSGKFSIARTLFCLFAALVSLGAAQAQSVFTFPPVWPEEAKLMASDGEAGDEFGGSVSVSGEVAVIGARNDDDGGSNAGAAYVLSYDGMSWVEEAKLMASDADIGDRFGLSVSLDGDVALIGSAAHDEVNFDSVFAYVFRYDGAGWIEEAKLTASDGRFDSNFGNSVSVHGDVAVVGAYLDNSPAIDSGSVYVFRFDGTNWNEEAKLTASDGDAFDRFGNSVSVHGNVVVVGAHLDDDAGSASGSAYVFRFDGTSWNEEAKLTASDATSFDLFGFSVSVHDNVAIVGATQADRGAIGNVGAAYAFRYDGANWIEETKISPFDGASSDGFGASVSVHGDETVVGAVFGSNNDGLRAGSAYVYRYGGTHWSFDGKLNASDGAELDGFGASVSVDGDLTLVGAVRALSFTGSSYVYRFDNIAFLLRELVSAVATLNVEGTISDGIYFALNMEIFNAARSYQRGNLNAACSQVQDFIDDVQEQIDSGQLDPADGDPLIETANELSALLGC